MADPHRSVRDLSLGWLTLPKASAVQVIEAAAAAGFGRASLRIAGRASEGDPGLAADAGLLGELRAALQANGVSLMHMGAVWLDGAHPVDDYEAALAAGAELGADTCVGIATPDRTPAQVQQDFTRLCRMARRHGLRVAVEFAAYLGVKSLQDADNLVLACGEPNAGILVDALHLFRSGGSVAALRTLPQGRIFFAQLCDAPQAAPRRERLQTEARGDRLDPGLGELPIAELVRGLPPHLPLEIEAPCLAYRNLVPRERAMRAAQAVQALLDMHSTTN